MSMKIRAEQVSGLDKKLAGFWKIAGEKVLLLDREYDMCKGSPVFTVEGKYTTRGWTEWTQGFQFGSALLVFDATGDERFLELGKKRTVEYMASHVSHVGVHDHGFNNVSTYGNLRRLMREKKIPWNEWEMHFYEMALKISGAVQAHRWSEHLEGGFIYSFNGPHSLFVDTIRSVRALMLAHQLGHSLSDENDVRVSLLERGVEHCRSTAQYSVYYGEGRDRYDVRGRTAHESIFNMNDGRYRCPNSQQGYTGFSTWTRGLAWAITGFAEELEFIETLADAELEPLGGREEVETFMLNAALATSDFYLENTPTDGIPYWDTGAPNLYKLGDYLDRPSDPYNAWEPVDSSAAAIAAQGLVRLGGYLQKKGKKEQGENYFKAGVQILDTLLNEPYLSTAPNHQGILLHSIYHQPNGWDHVPAGQKIACGESSMWGDYHLLELALLVGRLENQEAYPTFFA